MWCQIVIFHINMAIHSHSSASTQIIYRLLKVNPHCPRHDPQYDPFRWQKIWSWNWLCQIILLTSSISPWMSPTIIMLNKIFHKPSPPKKIPPKNHHIFFVFFSSPNLRFENYCSHGCLAKPAPMPARKSMEALGTGVRCIRNLNLGQVEALWEPKMPIFCPGKSTQHQDNLYIHP